MSMRAFGRPGLWTLLHSSVRGFSVAAAENVDKTMLSKLRKETGITFINCKKALTKFENNYDEAKKWLLEEAQKEGWARATKLQSRPMSQGLVAILKNNKQATMIEVNCETDFVAKNEKFIAMVTKLVQECGAHFDKCNERLISLGKSELDQIVGSDKSSLADFVALNIGNVGENMSLRRGAFLRSEPGSVLATYVHPTGLSTSEGSVVLGKYGAILELKAKTDSQQPVMPLSDLGTHLCQHIVGMNPKVIGEYVPRENRETGKPEETRGVEETDSGYSSDDSSESSQSQPATVEDDRLLQQDFLLDTTMTVGELLLNNGAEVTHFQRFACGEEFEGEKGEI